MPATGGFLEEILSHVPGVKLHLLAYYPVNPDLEGQEGWAAEALRYRTNQVLREANRGVEALAREMGAEYLDLNAPLLDGQGRLRAQYTKEGIHLYPAGLPGGAGGAAPRFAQPFLKKPENPHRPGRSP